MSIWNELDGSKERATYSSMAKAIKLEIPGHTLLHEIPGMIIAKLLERIEGIEKRIAILENKI